MSCKINLFSVFYAEKYDSNRVIILFVRFFLTNNMISNIDAMINDSVVLNYSNTENAMEQ